MASSTDSTAIAVVDVGGREIGEADGKRVVGEETVGDAVGASVSSIPEVPVVVMPVETVLVVVMLDDEVWVAAVVLADEVWLVAVAAVVVPSTSV